MSNQKSMKIGRIVLLNISAFALAVGALCLSAHAGIPDGGGSVKGVKVYAYKKESPKDAKKIIELRGEDAVSFYNSLQVDETKLGPWTNVGKRVLDKDGNVLIQCMKYEKSPLDCSIVIR